MAIRAKNVMPRSSLPTNAPLFPLGGGVNPAEQHLKKRQAIPYRHSLVFTFNQFSSMRNHKGFYNLTFYDLAAEAITYARTSYEM